MKPYKNKINRIRSFALSLIFHRGRHYVSWNILQKE